MTQLFTFIVSMVSIVFAFSVSKMVLSDKQAIERATRDYIESQHKVSPEQMKNSLHKDLKKRTYWKNKIGEEYIMETDYKTMITVAETYNKNGDKFPLNPKVEIEVLDIDQRVASVKLTVDDWIDYMHLMKNAKGDWKIINVLWQYHDTTKHSSHK